MVVVTTAPEHYSVTPQALHRHLFIRSSSQPWNQCQPHFTGQETEAQRGQVTCPRALSYSTHITSLNVHNSKRATTIISILQIRRLRQPQVK